MNPDQKPTKQTLALFWHHVSKYPAYLWGMVASVPFAVLTNRFLPALLVAGILDRLSRGDYNKDDIWGSFGNELLLTIGLWALGGIFIWRIVSYCNWKLESYVIRDLARRVFNHLMSLSATFHANNFGGSLVSQTNKLLGAYIRTTDTTIYQASTFFWSLLFTCVLLVGRAPLYVLGLLLFTAMYIGFSILTSRKIRELGAKHADAENRQTGDLADAVTNVLAVKSFAASKAEGKRFGKSTDATRHALMHLGRASLLREFGFTSIGTVINGMALVLAIVSIVVFKANVATVFLILTYTSNLLLQLWDFSTNVLRTYNRAMGDAEGMVKVLAIEPEVKDPKKPEEPRITKGAITFSSVDFTHPDQDDALFRELNITVKPSEKIGLVGHSGSGKTTLTKLLLRFNDIDGGEITIDGQNIANLSQDDLRRHIAYVPQEPLLFHRSINENIAYGNPDASDTAVREAARKAYADEFINKLPHGYDTLVGERGVKLSGGQRQRIAIARAILKDAPILVLDEATSALDSESEKVIQSALWELMAGRTAIVIAHRLSTVQKMDRIIVLDNGQIVEQGSHQTLLKKKGTYAKLWAHQSGGFLED